jgi:glutamate racemase
MIAVFDSGLGGLLALRALQEKLPHEDLLYFGDTAHLPYGDKSARAIRQLAKNALSFVLRFRPRAILAACGTVSAVALPTLRQESAVLLCGVAESACKAALAQSKTRRIGVIATAATIACGAYQDGIRRLCHGASVYAAACPLFVPLIESGHSATDPLVLEACRQYLSPFLEWEIDTLILGCTHYPLLAEAISSVLPNVTLIDAGRQAALSLCDALSPSEVEESGAVRFCVSEDPIGFSARATLFLGHPAKPVFAV